MDIYISYDASITLTGDKSQQPISIVCVQVLIVTFNLTGLPADAVFYYHLPIFRRFTFATFLYALSRTLMYVVTSFGLVYLGSYLGVYGLWVLTLPITIGYLYGVFHFEELEHNLGFYPYKANQYSKTITKTHNDLESANSTKHEGQKHGIIFKSQS